MSDAQPTCYGKHWDPNAAECRGGIDLAYEHPITKQHKRDPCRWYGSCAQATNAARAGQQPSGMLAPPVPPPPQSLVPVQQLVRPPAPPVPHGLVPPPSPPMYTHHAQQQQAQHLYANPGALVAPHLATYPSLVPANQPMHGVATQSFLMVPEPYHEDGATHMVRLLRTMLRSMLKAGALALANYLDYFPFGKKNQR